MTGILYAKVAGAWVPIAGAGGGVLLPVTGGTLTGPLLIDQTGEASLVSTGHPFQIGGQAGSPANMVFDSDEIQGRDGLGGPWPLNLQPQGGSVVVGRSTAAAALELRGPLPTGTPLNLYAGTQLVGRLYPLGPAVPADIVLQSLAPDGRDVSLQAAGKLHLAVGGSGTSCNLWVAAANERMKLDADNANWSYLAFYNVGGLIRRGYVGIRNDTDLVVAGENGDVVLNASTSSLAVGLRLVANNDIITSKEGAVTVNADGWQVVGLSATASWQAITNSVLNTPCFVANKLAAGAATSADFFHFRFTNTTRGSITATAGGTAFNTTSDYRLKNDLGPIEGAVERLSLLRPRRITWKSDETGTEQDAFLAHEVADVVPEAVTGEKDAVTPEPELVEQPVYDENGVIIGTEIVPDPNTPPGGEIQPQQLDTGKLVPLLVAAVQELTATVANLTARLDALEAP